MSVTVATIDWTARNAQVQAINFDSLAPHEVCQSKVPWPIDNHCMTALEA